MTDRSVLVRLVADNGSFDTAMTQSGRKVEDIGTKANIAGDVASQAMSRIKTAAVSILGVGLVKSGQDMINLQQSAQVAFTSMLGDATKASAAIKQIYDWDQTIPFPFQNMLAGAQKLLAYGEQWKDVIPTLQAIADATGAAGGNADTLDRVVLAIGQIQSKGRVMAQEMLQLTEAGIPAWQILADAMGITVPEAMKKSEQGAIDADTALTALREGIEERFPNAAQQLKNTTAGAFQSFTAGVRNAATSILTPLQGVESQAARTGKALLEMVGSGVGSVLQGLTSVLGGVSSAMGGVADAAGRIPTPISAVGVAMLATHLASTKLASAGDTLAVKTMYLTDRFRGFGEEMRLQQSLAAMAGQNLSTIGAAAATAGIRLGQLGEGAAGLGTKLLGAFGGPLGVSIIGATTALSLWGDAQQKAKQREAEHQAQLAALKDTIDKVSGALTAATTAKIAQDWVDDGTVKQMNQLGINTDLAVQAVTRGGPALDAFKTKLHDSALAAIEQSDAYGRMVARYGRSATDQAEAAATAIANGQGVINSLGKEAQTYADVGQAVVGTSTGLTQSAQQQREAFELVARSVASAAGVSADQLVPALDAAKASGGSVEDALKSANFTADQTSKIIQGLGDYVMQGAGDFHVMGGAAGVASTALAGVGSVTKETTDAIKAASDALATLYANMDHLYAGYVQKAQTLRQNISQNLTSFIDPTGAWNKAVDLANPTVKKTPVSQDPAVKAADAAVKAAQRRKESTVKSAQAERDAANKAAKATHDAAVQAAKDDTARAKSAQDAASKRSDAAKKEADALAKLADQRKKDSDDAKDEMDAATFRLRAAEMSLAAASAGLASATNPLEKASWQRAYNDALQEEAAARTAAAQATANYNAKAASSAATAKESAQAATEQTNAEAALATAKDNTAAVSEASSKRQQAADDAYQAAKDQADARYQKAVDAATAMLQALQDQQAATRQSAQDMANGSADAVGGMVQKVKPSFKEWMDQLAAQKKAQDDWATNLRDLSKKLPSDVVTYLASLGPGAADMIDLMNKQSVTELGKAVPLLRGAMPQWTDAIVSSILAGVDPSSKAFTTLGEEATNALYNELMAGKQPPNEILAKYGLALQKAADGTPIFIRIDADTTPAANRLAEFMASARFIGGTARSAYAYAKGGVVGDGWFTVGEDGPEIGYKSGNSVRIFPNGQTPAAAPASYVPPMPAPAPSGPTTVINQYMTAYYPQAEPVSVATNRELATIAAMDGLG